MKNESNNKEIPVPQDGDNSVNKKKKKKKITVTPLGTPEEIAELDAFLQDLYKTLSPKTAENIHKQLNDKQVDPMVIKAMLSEYMACFALLGYDIDGNRIIIKWAPSDQAEDSLIELVRCIFLNIAQNGYGNNPLEH